MTDRDSRLFLIDGHALAYRMFYAISQNLTTRSGELTNATMGFTRTVVNIITDDAPPEYLAVSFDVGRTFREDMYPEYKGTREKMPGELGRQIERIREVLAALNIPTLDAAGYEADDVLGTLARLAGEQGVHTLIITGDRDLLQLVNEHTIVQLPGHGNRRETDYNVAAVVDRYGVRPDQIVDWKGLVGDTSDNIPGVPGIGEKTAALLLNEYETLNGIYDHIEEIKGKRQETLIENKEQAYLSRDLARIVTDVPLEFSLDACRTRDFDPEPVTELFQELEFRSLMKQLRIGLEEAEPVTEGQQLSMFGDAAMVTVTVPLPESPTEPIIVTTEDGLSTMLDVLRAAPVIAFDTETTSVNQMQADLVGISLAVEEGTGYYIPVAHQDETVEQLPLDLIVEKLGPVLADPGIAKVGHNIKYDAIVLARHGMPVEPLSFDTMIGEYLVRTGSSMGKLGLKSMSFSRLGVQMIEIEQLIGKRGKNQMTFDQVSIENAAPYAAADADITLRLMKKVKPDLESLNMVSLFEDVEMPLVPVLCAMEQRGVLVDVKMLGRLSEEMAGRTAEMEHQVHQIAGYEFNVNSTQQLSDVLFGTLGIPTEGLRKTKSGSYSTASGVLEDIKPLDETGIVELIQDYRELEKLRSTYLDALPELVNPRTGRLHSSFNQVGTSTGRLSSSDPNLQNIPIRSEEGRRIREAFIAPQGYMLIGADYSQIELRVMAHLSGDEALRQAFLEDQDIHATTAASVYGIDLADVTPNQRSFAKAVNFGIMYGMGPYRLARSSDLTLAEAEDFIKTYFDRFPKVREYLDNTRQQAYDRGYVATMLGHRRYFPVLQSDAGGGSAARDRARAEREAINMPIQGSAADILKIAMIQLHEALLERGSNARMIVQIHDELLLEVPEAEVEEIEALVIETMNTAYPLAVPLKVEAHTGRHWGELK